METTVAKYHPITRYAYACAGLLAADGAYFTFTNPRTQQSVVVAVGVLLLVASIYMLCLLAAGVASVYLSMSRSTQRLAALAVAGPASFVLVMQSIGQLNVRDVLAVAPIACLAYFYFAYGQRSHKAG